MVTTTITHLRFVAKYACDYCTGELQPLDVGINDQFKALLKQEFSRWYASEVQQALRQGVAISEIKVDLRASLIKPLQLMNTVSTLFDTIKKPFETVRIIDIVQT